VCDECQTALVIRPDDEANKVRNRLEVYAAETHPIVRYYRDLGVLTAVDGSKGIAEVYEEIKAVYRAKMV
jgi:adenylate kinase